MGGYTNNQLHVREAHTTFSYLIFDGAERVATVDETRERLAHLFAAAPELLEALFALLPHVEHSDSCGDMDAYNNADVPTCGCGLDSARERANAAISRATGEGE